MNSRYAKLTVPGVMLATSLMAVYLAFYRPGYLSSTTFLGGLIFLQVLLAAVWKYEQRFFPLMVVGFLWAGMSLPFAGVWTSGRWAVLALGAIVGFALYMRGEGHHFTSFHLVAMFAGLAALVSAAISAFPMLAFLKALSLLLLFLYASTGARMALAGKEEKFFLRLVSLVEIFVYLSAVAYLILRMPIYGNPNSLGAIMGVVAVPVLFWGVLIAEGRTRYRRMVAAFMLAVGLLFFSQARAGILAAVVACCLTSIALRRYRLMIHGAVAFLCVGTLAIALTPSELSEDMPVRRAGSSLAAMVLYKGHEESGVLGSRRTPWDETISVIKQHPWFGAGFGTTLNTTNQDIGTGQYATVSASTREHGNSYLAIMEGVGLLGVVPFAVLVITLAIKVGGLFAWLRRSAKLNHCAVPVAMVLAAGLIHAGFEDWLFAVGYYLSVFFWVLAFVFIDILPVPARAAVSRPVPAFGFNPLRRDVHAVAPER